MSRTLLALLVPDAEPWVGELRARYDPSAKLGFAPHITLVYPFFDSEDLSASRLRRLDDVAAMHSALTFSLDRIATFPSTVWLAPEPSAPIAALAAALEVAFPERPRATREFGHYVPHLSVARNLRDEDAVAEMTLQLASRLPLPGTVSYACRELRVMRRDGQGWRSVHAAPLREVPA